MPVQFSINCDARSVTNIEEYESDDDLEQLGKTTNSKTSSEDGTNSQSEESKNIAIPLEKNA